MHASGAGFLTASLCNHLCMLITVSMQVICDHLGLGVKTGKPYIWHSKASNPFVNLKKEFHGIFWQEDIIPFFEDLQLPESASTVAECYRSLAKQVRTIIIDLWCLAAASLQECLHMCTWLSLRNEQQ